MCVWCRSHKPVDNNMAYLSTRLCRVSAQHRQQQCIDWLTQGTPCNGSPTLINMLSYVMHVVCCVLCGLSIWHDFKLWTCVHAYRSDVKGSGTRNSYSAAVEGFCLLFLHLLLALTTSRAHNISALFWPREVDVCSTAKSCWRLT